MVFSVSDLDAFTVFRLDKTVTSYDVVVIKQHKIQ